MYGSAAKQEILGILLKAPAVHPRDLLLLFLQGYGKGGELLVDIGLQAGDAEFA